MMSSGGEDSAENTMGIRGIPEQCGCGRRTGIYTSKTKETPGRTFFRCPTFRNDHLYKWVDEAVYEEVQDALPKVDCFASDLRKLKMEIESLKNVEEELKEDVRKASNEVKKLNVIVKVGFLVASVSYYVCLCLIVFCFITKIKTQICTTNFLNASNTVLIFPTIITYIPKFFIII
ncbi:uncharacterized protein At1g43920, Chloroplastic-like [Raphanus sativus]|uniref:Uncharacterized protein At1g43920, Chloroplastic-like n=1 Tax=Raphanus sativus TaxID=3726 RepID=A0A6J0LUM0_RAPSA|nr:uncharacterized protein At1g43920, Chloroplastic-like [Raphanus sativus]